MTAALRDWILGLCGAALLCAVALLVCPAGRVKKILQTVCGVVMAIELISPVIGIDFGYYSRELARYREEARALTEPALAGEDRLLRTIIESECSAYILDKAEMLGCALSFAEVGAVWSEDGFWYPWEARLGAPDGSAGKEALAAAIEGELGIPAERQHWEVT